MRITVNTWCGNVKVLRQCARTKLRNISMVAFAHWWAPLSCLAKYTRKRLAMRARNKSIQCGCILVTCVGDWSQSSLGQISRSDSCSEALAALRWSFLLLHSSLYTSQEYTSGFADDKLWEMFGEGRKHRVSKRSIKSMTWGQGTTHFLGILGEILMWLDFLYCSKVWRLDCTFSQRITKQLATNFYLARNRKRWMYT